jgi:murein DD-endopeptidase MepM/ murein hydrolase activator NlpD
VVLRMQNGKKYYTIMFIPEGNSKTFSIHVYRHIIYSLIIFIVIFLLGFFCLVLKSGEIAAKLQLVNALRNENKKLMEQNQKLNYVCEKIDKIEAMGIYLQRIATAAGDSVKYRINANTGLTTEENYKKEDIDEVAYKEKISETDAYKDLRQKSGISEDFLSSVPNIQPTEGWITRKFVAQSDEFDEIHNGVDFAATSGTPIRSTARGIVEDVYKDTYFGNIVTIKHGYGFVTRYGHCLQILVKIGDFVERGQTIALVGNTGRSTAPHLHYEVIKDGKNVDPKEFLIKIQK